MSNIKMSDFPRGLTLVEDYISKDYEAEIIDWIDLQKWSNSISRRTQHYGYEYNYTSRNLKKTTPLFGIIADIQKDLCNILKPNQCIINEYKYNQGISAHIDSFLFGPTIASISLNEDTVMTFEYKDKICNFFVPKRSLLVLEDDARYKWLHSISKNIVYTHLDEKIVKPKDYRRISLTFRKTV